jgi:lipoate-protein ligase A
VIALVAPHPSPRRDVIARFRRFSDAIAAALRDLAIDARVGSVAGEYCPGDYSVNGGGRIKLAGVAQRIGRRGYHLGAVIAVQRSPLVMEAVAAAYHIYGFDFAPDSFGALADMDGNIAFPDVRTALLRAMPALAGPSP